MENMSKLPEIPDASVAFVPPAGHTQDQIFAAFNGPMINEKLKEEYEESPSSSQPVSVDDIMLPDPTPQGSIHSREKTSFTSAAKNLKSGLISCGIMPDDSIVNTIVKHSKHAILSPTEIEAISITIRACQEEYALNLLRSSIDDLTAKIRAMTAELDDASKRAKGVNHSLTQNIELINAQTNSLKVKESLPPPRTEIPVAMDHNDKANLMLGPFLQKNNPGTATVIKRFAEHLKVDMPHLSIESFAGMSRPQRLEYISSVNKKYSHIS